MGAGLRIAEAYAPGGEFRVALNFGNRVLLGRGAGEAPAGISVDLAFAISAAVGLKPQFVEFERAIDVANSADQGLWDLCFLAVDPARARTIAFSDPYVRISGSYLVSGRVAAQRAVDVVTRGLRVAVVEGSAYTLHLSRQPGAEHLVVMPDILAALAALEDGIVDAVAGIEQAMQAQADRHDGWRVLTPPFMEIEQAVGVPADRLAAATHLKGLIAAMTRSGMVADVLERHGVARTCAIITPPA